MHRCITIYLSSVTACRPAPFSASENHLHMYIHMYKYMFTYMHVPVHNDMPVKRDWLPPATLLASENYVYMYVHVYIYINAYIYVYIHVICIYRCVTICLPSVTGCCLALFLPRKITYDTCLYTYQYIYTYIHICIYTGASRSACQAWLAAARSLSRLGKPPA